MAITSTCMLPLPPFRLHGRTHQSLRDPSSQPEADGVERETAKAASAKPMKLQGNTRDPCGILANCAGKHEASGVGCGRVQATSQGVIMGRKLRHRHDRYELSNALTSTNVLSP